MGDKGQAVESILSHIERAIAADEARAPGEPATKKLRALSQAGHLLRSVALEAEFFDSRILETFEVLLR